MITRLTWFIDQEVQDTEDGARRLLRDMLPKHVLDEFQQDKLKLVYQHERMTFLFADICGFTSYANSVSPSEVKTKVFNSNIVFSSVGCLSLANIVCFIR